MILLTQLPACVPANVADVLALAHAMEREAAARYAALARSMRRVRHDDVAQVLEDLAAEERHHVVQVERLAEHLLHRPPDPDVARWEFPQTLTTEGDSGAAQLTPYRALAIAVRNEERAFAFWSYVAASSTTTQVRAQAEAMARQELLHAAKLRHERRRAYHAARAIQPSSSDEPPPATVNAARAEAARLEAEAAAFLEAAAERLAADKDTTSAVLLRDIAAQMRASLPAGGATDLYQPDAQTIARAVRAFGAGGSAPLLFEASGVVERLAITYIEWLGANADPAFAEALEPLERAAAQRLARIEARLTEIAPELRNLLTAPPPVM